MKYISLSSVSSAYDANVSTTTNRFWGLIGILSALDSVVRPSVSYNFFSYKASEKLDSLFIISDDKGTGYRKDTVRSVMFCKDWVHCLSEGGLLKNSSTPNVYNVMTWYFRNRPFADEVTVSDLLKQFLEELHLSIETARQFFLFDKTDITFSEDKYSETDLLSQIGLSSVNITAERNTVAAKPGDFTRGPLLQPLYASQDVVRCFLLTPFDFSQYYLNSDTEEEETLVLASQGCRDFLRKLLRKLYRPTRIFHYWNRRLQHRRSISESTDAELVSSLITGNY